MFKLDYINVGYSNKSIESTHYVFMDSTYIYGGNNVGKTAMLKAIDFVLGKSDFKLDKQEGLDNIDYIEAKICVEQDNLYIKRSVDGSFAYKYYEKEGYLVTNYELYKSELTFFINRGKDKYLQIFNDFAGETLSYRAFSFVNFVDEKGLGNLTNIFTRANDYNHQIRIRKLMTFIFNYENIRRLTELELKEKTLQAELDKFKDERNTRNYFIGIIKKQMLSLQLKLSDDVGEMQKSFTEYKRSFERNSDNLAKATGDVGYLIKVSYALSEEIKYQKSLELQSQKLTSRNARAKSLLMAFEEIIQKDDSYRDYAKEIEELIQKQISNNDILSLKDYSKTIIAIENKKKKIDKDIEACLVGLNKNKYEDTVKVIGVLEQTFSEIEKCSHIIEIDEKEKQLKLVTNQIKDLNKKFDETLKNRFNKIILEFYEELKGKTNFADEDFKKLSFKMDFDPIKISIAGLKAKNEKNLNDLISYNPGSMARETTWQILAYLTMFKIFAENFSELPVMKILFIDGLNQPFDESPECYPNVYRFFQEKAKEVGVQLVVVSTKDGISIGADHQINLSDGFNKAHMN